MRGRWDYTDARVLDRTHVRFFTKSSMVTLFEDAGYVVDSIVGVNSVSRHPRIPRALTGVRHLLGSGQWQQFVVLAHPSDPAP